MRIRLLGALGSGLVLGLIGCGGGGSRTTEVQISVTKVTTPPGVISAINGLEIDLNVEDEASNTVITARTFMQGNFLFDSAGTLTPTTMPTYKLTLHHGQKLVGVMACTQTIPTDVGQQSQTVDLGSFETIGSGGSYSVRNLSTTTGAYVETDFQVLPQ